MAEEGLIESLHRELYTQALESKAKERTLTQALEAKEKPKRTWDRQCKIEDGDFASLSTKALRKLKREC
jgi:hypothetical protein